VGLHALQAPNDIRNVFALALDALDEHVARGFDEIVAPFMVPCRGRRTGFAGFGERAEETCGDWVHSPHVRTEVFSGASVFFVFRVGRGRLGGGPPPKPRLFWVLAFTLTLRLPMWLACQ
jgi:hypothetical protein